MNRQTIRYLQDWFARADRKPLLLRGARQIGKTWTVRELARVLNLRLVEVNFELSPQAKDAFRSQNPSEILKALAFLGYPPVESGLSLLLLDEIQECPQAIAALRYFYELGKNSSDGQQHWQRLYRKHSDTLVQKIFIELLLKWV